MIFVTKIGLAIYIAIYTSIGKSIVQNNKNLEDIHNISLEVQIIITILALQMF